MKLLPILLVQAVFVNLAFALPKAELSLPNGFYIERRHTNGTLETTKLDVSTRSKKSASTSRRAPAKLSKRWWYCGGIALDHADTDQGVQDWKDFVGDDDATFQSHNYECTAWVYLNNGVGISYFIMARFHTGSLDLEDINYALEQMDYYCVRYTGSTWRWDAGSSEGFAKSAPGHNIC